MAFTLTVTRERRAVDRFEFGEGLTLRVGRGEECEVRLEGRDISRYHCEIASRGELQVVRDLGSSNGTFVNGRRLSAEHNLNDGDVVTAGEFTLRYAAGRSDAPAPKVVALLPTDGFDQTLQVSTSAAPAVSARAVPRASAHLEVLGPGQPRTVIIRSAAFLVGGGDVADLHTAGRSGPRIAAAIVRDGERFEAVDLSPRRNALRIDGLAVPAGELTDGTALEVGGLQLRFRAGLPKLDPELPTRKVPTRS